LPATDLRRWVRPGIIGHSTAGYRRRSPATGQGRPGGRQFAPGPCERGEAIVKRPGTDRRRPRYCPGTNIMLRSMDRAGHSTHGSESTGADELLAHLSPFGREHTDRTGDHVWKPDCGTNNRPLCQLRLPVSGGEPNPWRTILSVPRRDPSGVLGGRHVDAVHGPTRRQLERDRPPARAQFVAGHLLSSRQCDLPNQAAGPELDLPWGRGHDP